MGIRFAKLREFGIDSLNFAAYFLTKLLTLKNKTLTILITDKNNTQHLLCLPKN